MQAVTTAAPLLQRFLRTKARLYAKDLIGFQDLSVGMPAPHDPTPGPACRQEDFPALFETTLPGVAQTFSELLDRKWLKLGNAVSGNFGDFCAPFPKIGQCRVVVNFSGSLADLNTLALELGHAYHASILGQRRFWQQQVPVTLAETASTVAEAVFRRAALDRAQEQDNSAWHTADILMLELNKAVTYLALAPSAFVFEQSLYRARAGGELPVAQLNALSRQSQEHFFAGAVTSEAMRSLPGSPISCSTSRVIHTTISLIFSATCCQNSLWKCLQTLTLPNDSKTS